VAESYPHERFATADQDGEYQRLLMRLRQDEVQLVADQRQLRQQRTALERLNVELDARQQELDAAVHSLQRERQAFETQKRSSTDGQDAQGTALSHRQQDLDQRAAQLEKADQELQARSRQLESHHQTLLEQECRIQSQAQHLAGEQRGLLAEQAALRADQESARARVQSLDDRQASLDRGEADLQARARQVDSHQRDAQDLAGQRKQLQRREAELREQFEARQQALHEQAERRDKQVLEQAARLEQAQQQLAARFDTLARQEAALGRENEILTALRADLKTRQAAIERLEADLAAAQKTLQQRQADLADLQARSDRLAKDRQDLQARQEALLRWQEQQTALDSRLAEKQRQIEELDADLTRRQQSFESAQAAAKVTLAAPRDPQLVAAGEQIATQSRRLQVMQAEVSQLRDQKQAVLTQRDDLSRQCAALQSEVDALMAAQKSKPVIVVSPDSHLTPAADDIAALASHATWIRRRGARTAALSRGADRTGLMVAGAVAVLVGMLAGLVLLQLVPGRYWLQARIAFAKDSPLAAGSQLASAQRDLGGRLIEARLPGMLLPQDRPPVTADIKAACLTVQVLTLAPDPSQAGLRDLLVKYRSELEGGIQDAARAQQDRELADLLATTEQQRATFAAERQALLAQAEKFQPQAKAYQNALAAAEKTRKSLDDANRKNEDLAARLRVLRRTPPGARVELSAERLAAAAAADVQLTEVRSQATARAEELRMLLDGLLTGATQKCDQMDDQLDKFLEFLAGQQGQMAEEALRSETAAIARQVSRLKAVIQQCRKQINDLAGVLAKTRDVAQAASLVAVQAQSEKALESLTIEAADQIKHVDDLLEKIPAGGVDVTRRTVLQQRLRSRFAEAQKTQHEMTETLNTLRPAVNFRLDAALSAVSGLTRRLQDRQKTLAEQIQQQDAQSRRLEYDRQLQQAQGESDELGVERDRLTALLTQATQEMLDAEPGRTRLIQIRAQVDDLDRKISAAKAGMEAAQQKQTTLQAAATQPPVIRLDEPQVLHPAANRTARMVVAAVSAVLVALLAFGGWLAVTGRRAMRATVVPQSVELTASRD
jgi:chromosome segregation ATPase